MKLNRELEIWSIDSQHLGSGCTKERKNFKISSDTKESYWIVFFKMIKLIC